MSFRPRVSHERVRMPVLSKCYSGLVKGWALILCLLCVGLSSHLEAQRHPESAGALPYYRDEPGLLREPDWKQRPPFVRGPRDRYDRGRTRQFLATGDGVAYTNYADQKYILYLRELTPWAIQGGRPFNSRNVRWDRVGNYMGNSYQRVFSIEEARSDLPGNGMSYVDHKFLTLRIGHYTYKNLHWTATVGNDVRTSFTPLTLGQSHMHVARMDINYMGKDRATVLYGRGGQIGSNVLFSNWVEASGDDSIQESPVLLYGAHWQHDVGNYATFGGTFLNQIMSSAALGSSSAFRGDLPYSMVGPKNIQVFIADDSPEEIWANAKVYDVDIILQGEREGEPVRLTSIDNDPDYDVRLNPTVSGGQVLAEGGREAVGKETVIYSFSTPAEVTVRSARFVAEVANDYRIGVRQTHDYVGVTRNGDPDIREQAWPKSEVITEKGSRRPFKWYIDEDEVPYYTVARSEGKGTNGANRRMVSFDYGMPTGQSLASIDWDARLVGLKLSGEAAHNLQNYMFPVGSNEGQRTTQRAWAYWLKGTKELGAGIELSGELYRMEPDYSGGYDSYRGGMAFHYDNQASPGARVESRTQEFPLVEDNDDNDYWPDEHANETPVSGDLYPGWPNAMVYPGLDENEDSVADLDRNENFIPDWEESFLTFHSEPPEFVYGIDFNNNDMPDFRENDDRPDYPYRRDQKGHHLFLRFDRLSWLGTSLAVGFYDGRQIDGGGESKALYLRYSYERQKVGTGEIKINYDFKKVEDDIPDASYVYFVSPEDVDIIPWLNKPDGPPDRAGLYRPATPDPMVMRDSWVNTAFIESQYQGFHNINIYNGMLWSRNSQAEIELDDGSGLLQSEDVRSRFSLVNKIEYAWTKGGLTLQPKFKHRLIYEAVDSEDDPRRSYSDFIPILAAEYQLTANTHFLAGAQGMPFVPFKHWDRGDKDDTYGQTDYLLMVRIRAEYFGIRDNSLFFGYQRTRREYSRFEERNIKRGTLFVELISPF